MKSVTIAAALLASAAVAQPHGHQRHHHEKRDLVTEYETVWETATVIIGDDVTETILPSPKETATKGSPGQFFQPEDLSSSSSSSSSSSTTTTSTLVESPPAPTMEALPQTPTTTTVNLATYQAPSSPAAPTTTPIPAAPTYQTTAQAASSTTSTYAAPPPASTGGSSGGSSDGIPFGQQFSGEITYYNAGLGACGFADDGIDDTKNIVAIPKAFWDSISTLTSYGLNQPAHPLCGKTITITSPDGKTAQALAHDRCDGCAGHAIDVTPHTFLELFGSLDAGRLDCTWEINE
ncbi:hypothetical protein GGR54DRAFT_594419 [Hypoxylon sp. NC1633]|nr:hypothetical protein GGR54DRAFT_594419 [Hypoxylon sp. NC1633]